MKIETKTMYPSRLSKIEDGECFIGDFNNGKPMMKVHTSKEFIVKSGFRAVDIETGTLCIEISDCDVLPVRTKVVVEGGNGYYQGT